MFNEEKYNEYISDWEQYDTHLRDLFKAMRKPDSEARMRTSKAFSEWMNENSNRNPFE